MTREEILKKIKAGKVIAIARGVGGGSCTDLAKALLAGGIRAMEITFSQKDPDSWRETAGAIRLLRETLRGEMLIGAGTVVLPEQLEMAYQAGAQFIISPDSNEEIIRRTVKLGMVSIPGAMTPTEILAAYRWGADMVKVFPAGNLGPGYFKAICAPINHIPLLATGGVNENNLAEYLAAGAAGAGIGGNLVKKEWIQNGEFGKITEAARLIAAATGE